MYFIELRRIKLIHFPKSIKNAPNRMDQKDRVTIMQSLKKSEIRYRRLFEAAQDGILILDAKTGMIEDVNPFLIKMLGYSREEFVEKKLWEVGAFKDIKASKEAFEALQSSEYIRYDHLPLKTKDGHLVQVEFISNVYLAGNERVIQCNIRDNTEYKRIVAALQENEKKYHDLINQSPDGYFVIELTGNILTVNKAMCKELEFSQEEFLSMSIWDIIPGEYLQQYQERLTKVLKGESFKESAEYEVLGKSGGKHYVEVLSAPRYSGDNLIGFQGIARDITARKRTEAALRESEERFSQVWDVTSDAMALSDPEGIVFAANPAYHNLFGYTPEQVIGKSFAIIFPAEFQEQALKQYKITFASQVIPAPFEATIQRTDGLKRIVESTATFLSAAGQRTAMLSTIRDITERSQAQKKIQRQFDHLTALSTIDRVIASNFDLQICLSEILSQVTKELGIDAADILIFNPNSQTLVFGAERGFRTQAARKASVRLGESYAGRAALERQLVEIPDLKNEPDNLLLTAFLNGEDFVSYYGVPLITKGQVKGVLEAFHRTALEPDQEWFDFLNALAGQAAIAIENVTLFDGLQRSNSELALAYDATIEGWSRALDLRDKETEWHTQRVTEMTVKLAHAFGMSDSDLIQVRWGALLHDIGKMGIPDNILHKPGPLTDEEWVIMKSHPTLAYNLLAPIRYLRLALDIPYCHHEKWDGSGYPHGLQNTQIPLVARIFAVADVWDALSSDRPYRAAWPEDKVREHIQVASGTHFDPQVVEVFSQILE
jgi:PAS domain S-box-containing protein/putative nucleotidyltransferase with HDIG domain